MEFGLDHSLASSIRALSEREEDSHESKSCRVQPAGRWSFTPRYSKLRSELPWEPVIHLPPRRRNYRRYGADLGCRLGPQSCERGIRNLSGWRAVSFAAPPGGSGLWSILTHDNPGQLPLSDRPSLPKSPRPWRDERAGDPTPCAS